MTALPPLAPDGAAARDGAGEDAEGAGAEGAGGGVGGGGRAGVFHVHLDAFEGPFDLLLGLIARHKLDVTEIALSKVTDEFIAYIRGHGPDWDLGQATEFLVVAATLLDLKAVRLLPAAEVEDEEDLALLEARDLLFARLLQYRAYKQVAALLAERLAAASRCFPRTVGPDPAFANLLPEVLIGVTPDAFAALAARVMAPKPVPTVSIAHIHAPQVSVRDQARVLVDRLRRLRTATFRALIADAPDTLTVVARFLALLELFREAAVAFEQLDPLGELHIRWTGADEGEPAVTDEFDAGQAAEDAPEDAGRDGTSAQGETAAEVPAPPVDLRAARARRALARRAAPADHDDGG